MIASLMSPLLSDANANVDAAPGPRCWQAIHSIDEQADIDVREIQRMIALLEEELGDQATASGGTASQDQLRTRIETANRTVPTSSTSNTTI
jgi:hypothetical protein